MGEARPTKRTPIVARHGMVALLTEFHGVGPTQAKTYYVEDLVSRVFGRARRRSRTGNLLITNQVLCQLS